MSDVKVAVVGCGHWGKNHVRNFAELGALTAVVDPRAEVAKQFADQYSVKALSFDEAIASDDVDAVVIAAPAELHADLAVKAFEAGKHVFVEKPISMTMEEGNRMKAAGEKAGKVLMVGHLLQYHPAFVALREFVLGGGLGKLRYAYSHRCSLGKFRVEENALWSFAPHDVSMLLALFGEAPDTVTGTGGAFVTDGIEDECRLDMTFPGGGRAHVFASWLHPFKEHRLIVVGETGMAVFEDSQNDPAQKLRLYRHSIDTSGREPAPSKADAEPIPYGDDEPLKTECAHFLSACAGDHPALTDADEALRVLDVLLKASKD
ncbi:Gfo/Idh/MocA family protein [Hyphobacterium marinum]|uniref:Gfo/Idh/MocA family oxidoreductase n=1 Tax=Hyphobacterium marinum TaxID=3116574 RepID=A0ABU7LY57_9PROT|nr:Gfo/Idh/MocA family oxidoreductase [Hyphobacterium sp. Y6023]MEE2566481.1 Gfo/Idh/MocA family oxidoreductase [Hyphobacterium sp. Y6023]